MSFKEMVSADNKAVFMNPDEFADLRTVIYDGERYEDIPIILSKPKERDRRKMTLRHSRSTWRITRSS